MIEILQFLYNNWGTSLGILVVGGVILFLMYRHSKTALNFGFFKLLFCALVGITAVLSALALLHHIFR